MLSITISYSVDIISFLPNTAGLVRWYVKLLWPSNAYYSWHGENLVILVWFGVHGDNPLVMLQLTSGVAPDDSVPGSHGVTTAAASCR